MASSMSLASVMTGANASIQGCHVTELKIRATPLDTKVEIYAALVIERLSFGRAIDHHRHFSSRDKRTHKAAHVASVGMQKPFARVLHDPERIISAMVAHDGQRCSECVPLAEQCKRLPQGGRCEFTKARLIVGVLNLSLRQLRKHRRHDGLGLGHRAFRGAKQRSADAFRIEKLSVGTDQFGTPIKTLL
jgi:hypothetical protein